MSTPTSLYYFCQSVDKDGKFIYLQLLKSRTVTKKDRISRTYFPEFAERFDTKLDAFKFLIFLEFLEGESEVNWEVVLFEISIERPSWALMPINKYYKNLLEGIILPDMYDFKEELYKYKLELEESHVNKN